LLPNFLVVGAAKSGTTSLYHYLKQHPEIYMSPIKEPYFFSFINKEPDFKGPFDEKTNETIITDLSDYEKLFENVDSEKAIGECSTSYLYFPESAMNIKKYIPNCKIIIILRNPIERAYSHYMQSAMIGHENLSFEEAIKKEDERKKLNWRWHYYYTAQSMYYEQVKRYFDIFGREKVRVYLFDDLKKEPLELVKKMYGFLEVDNNFVPKVIIKNKSGDVRLKFVMNFLWKPNKLKNFAKLFTTKRFRASIYNFVINNTIKEYSMNKEIKEKTKILFNDDIHNLQNLINKDLSKW